MGLNITRKILNEHLVDGTLTPGAEVGIRIDQTLTQDATGTMAYLQFESMGLDRVRVDLAVSYVDHNTIQVGFENADDHAYLQSVAAAYGIVFSRPGNGICHQVHLERFGAPGRTLIGSDSHTPTGGGLGMFAIGAGGIDVALAMGGGPFYLACPRVLKVHLTGALSPWVSAKDVVLHMLGLLGTKGNVGWVIEYGGPGVASLDVPQRATIANMGAEMGVTTSVFPSDAVTKQFLEAQGRGGVWRGLAADPDAVYDREITLDLSHIEPLAAAPHSPGHVVTIASLAGQTVNQVLIGSCTNGSYRDLKTVALMLRGRKIHPNVCLGIAPGSRQTMEMLADEGLLGELLRAGARLFETACGFCIGNHASPGTGAVSVRTSNRNFEGRSGTPSAQVYLVSPETAAATALAGVFVDPRSMAMACPEVAPPARYELDDSLFIVPSAAAAGGPIVRGPNIGTVPRNTPLPEALSGVVTIKVGDKVTTDHIMPAGARLKYRSNVPRYAAFVFEPVDPSFATRAAGHRDAGRHNLIVAGESYGQGSSREHAALCPMYLGVKAVLARSMERIHLANLINFGILPLSFENPSDYDRLQADDRIEIAGVRAALAGDGRMTVRVDARDLAIPVRAELSERQRRIVLAGGLLNLVARG